MINEELILNLVEDTDKILYTFEKDGNFAMSSSIRNELFQEANASLKQVKEALAQPAQKPRLDQGPDYERGFVDGMLYQTQTSIDKAVNAMAQPLEARNFCPRCGKRLGGDVNYIHTCTPPRGLEMT